MTQSDQGTDKRGVRGWLLFFVIVLAAIGPFYLIGSTSNNLGSTEKELPSLLASEAWATYKSISWTMVCIAMALRLIAGYRLLRVFEPASVNWAILALWVSGPMLVLADVLATIIIFPVSIFDAVSFDIVKAMASALLTAGIWTIYLRRSRRVRNTYGSHKDESMATPAADGSA